MKFIDTIEALESHYGTPSEAALVKVAPRLTESYRAFIERSRFCVLSTVGPEGTDASPRGDDGPVVAILDAQTLALPDWRGNNRIDSLRNIVADGRVSLMFFVPGSTSVVRINGRARLTADAALRARFARSGKEPRTVAVIAIGEAYFQCARALMRARLWAGEDESAGLPTPGAMLQEITRGQVDGERYDTEWPERAAQSMW
jgi:PPOX class probable FMN-dependent enzyme